MDGKPQGVRVKAMSETDELVLPISEHVCHCIAEAERRLGLSRHELLSALVEWLATQDLSVQEKVLCADRIGGSDLAQVFTEWHGSE